VRLMNGEIWVSSEPGHGSTFSFIAEFKMALAPLSLPIPGFRGLPVMLVDGDEISRELLKQLLAGWGTELFEARNTSEALHELSEARGAGRQFSLFLINADLPDTSDLARHLRARGEGPIIFLASLKTAAISRALEGHLVQAIVMKPVLPETLSRAMETALRPAAAAARRQ
jgi:two-component system, sensor histidine kinase and response regulator